MKNILKNKLVKNTSWIMIEKIFQMIISLVVGMITARYLGPSNYGMISYVAAFIAFATPICNLGMDAVLIKKIVEYPDEEGKYVGTAIVMELIASIISYIVIVLIIALNDFSDTTKIIVVILQSLLLIAKSTEPIDYYFQSKLLSKYTSLIKMIGYLIMSGYKIYLVVTQKSIEWFAFASSLDMIVIAILYLYTYKKKKGQKLKFNINIGKKIIKESYHFILSNLLIILYTQMDKMMIGKMLSNNEVGLYTAATTICTYWGFIPLAIINTFRPIIYEAKKKNTKYLEKLKFLYCLTFWISIFFCIIITIFSKQIIWILYGKDFLAAKITLIIAVWYTAFAYLGTARGIWIVSEGKHKYVKKYVLIGAIMNFILNYYLIPIYGINGAAFATLITQFIVAIIAPLFYKETRISTKYMIDAILFKGVSIYNVKKIKEK